jgi:hypothetical protein
MLWETIKAIPRLKLTDIETTTIAAAFDTYASISFFSSSPSSSLSSSLLLPHLPLPLFLI